MKHKNIHLLFRQFARSVLCPRVFMYHLHIVLFKYLSDTDSAPVGGLARLVANFHGVLDFFLSGLKNIFLKRPSTRVTYFFILHNLPKTFFFNMDITF
jgi:hypothetical protein